jgi:mannose-1-phosphate guanylyltransferase
LRSIILVGGEGTRLRPLTLRTPKQMLPLVGVPMIECVLEELARHGVTEVVLSVGYLPDQFEAAYPENRIGGVKVTYAVEPERLDTAGAIRFAAATAGIDETFLVMNGDILTDLDITSLVAFHRERGAEATIALHAVEDPSRYGVVDCDDEGRVGSFIEKPAPGEAPSNLINAGVYVMEPSVLERIAPDRRVNVERETFPQLAAAGSLYARAQDAYWLDTGTPTTYLEANADILAGRDGRVVPGVVDGSWVHERAVVAPAARLDAAVVDRDCRVEGSARLDHAVLLPGAVVESGAVVRSSIVGPGAVIGAGAVLEATCVVGPDERVEPGMTLAGDVRVGGV